MAQILDLGKIRMNWAGNYSAIVEYEYNDIVKYGPNVYAYVASAAATGVTPVSGGSTWQLVTQGTEWLGTYTANQAYKVNELVTDGISTYIVTAAHTSANPVGALPNAYTSTFALGQEGLPNQTGNESKVLTTNGTSTAWSATINLNKEYVGTSQGGSASDFETTAGLTDSVAVFAKSTGDFAQLPFVNPSNGANASTDFIAYTADGTNDSGWIDMGITSNDFSAATYGITGAHDGYIFMSAPRTFQFDVLSKIVVAGVATVTLGATHAYQVGDVVKLEGVGTGFDGLQTISAKTGTTFSFTTALSPFSLVNLSPFGTTYKPYGDGNLVIATDRTGLSNSIVFAAGGYDSGSTQMSIIPDDRVHIEIDTESTSSVTGALTVAGGIGLTGNLNIGGDLAVVGQVDFSGVDTLPIGPGAAAFADTLTNPTVVAVTNHSNYAQIAHQNKSNAIAASTDIIMYPDNGGDGAGFIDMGITSSNFADPLFTITGKNDGYIFMSAPEGTAGRGDLVIATGDTGTQNRIVFAAGGYASNNTQMTIYPDDKVHIEIPTPSTSPTTGALTVVGGVGITGDVNIAGNITFGGEGTQVGTANLAVEAPFIYMGDGSTSTTNDLGIITEGVYAVTNIPTRSVVNKVLVSNVATLETTVAHKFATGDSVVVANIDATFNGTYTITDVPTTTTFSYAKTATNVSSTRIGDTTFSINNKVLTGNVATLTTSATHNFLAGQTVVVTGVDATFNGTFTITAPVTGTTFSYAKTASNVPSAAVSPVGSATVNTTTSTAVVATAQRTRWSAFSKDATDQTWKFLTNISTKPTTTVDYTQNTYGNGVDVVYEKLALGSITLNGSGSLYGAPYGTLTFTGDISSPSWTTTGIRHVGASASTLTDTTSSGTVPAAYTNTFGSSTTIAATSATTYTKYANAYFGTPTAGTNVTITAGYSIETAGALLVGGLINMSGNLNINTNKFNVTASTGATAIAGDLAVATNKFTVASTTGNTAVAGTLGVTGLTTLTGGATITGTTELNEVRESVAVVTLTSNAGTFDWTASNLYYADASAQSAALTFNLTNVPTDNNYMMTVNVMVNQGATGRIPTTFNINGSAATIRWAYGITPTPTSVNGKIDFFSFNLYRTAAGAWIVFGSVVTNF